MSFGPGGGFGDSHGGGGGHGFGGRPSGGGGRSDPYADHPAYSPDAGGRIGSPGGRGGDNKPNPMMEHPAYSPTAGGRIGLPSSPGGRSDPMSQMMMDAALGAIGSNPNFGEEHLEGLSNQQLGKVTDLVSQGYHVQDALSAASGSLDFGEQNLAADAHQFEREIADARMKTEAAMDYAMEMESTIPRSRIQDHQAIQQEKARLEGNMQKLDGMTHMSRTDMARMAYGDIKTPQDALEAQTRFGEAFGEVLGQDLGGLVDVQGALEAGYGIDNLEEATRNVSLGDIMSGASAVLSPSPASLTSAGIRALGRLAPTLQGRLAAQSIDKGRKRTGSIGSAVQAGGILNQNLDIFNLGRVLANDVLGLGIGTVMAGSRGMVSTNPSIGTLQSKLGDGFGRMNDGNGRVQLAGNQTRKKGSDRKQILHSSAGGKQGGSGGSKDFSISSINMPESRGVLAPGDTEFGKDMDELDIDSFLEKTGKNTGIYWLQKLADQITF